MLALLALCIGTSLGGTSLVGTSLHLPGGPGTSIGLGPTLASRLPFARAPLPGPSPSAPAPVLNYCFGGQITADNSYIVGLGSSTSMGIVLGSQCNTTAEDIFSCATGPESFGLCFAGGSLPTYVYIVAWSDDLVTSGVLASLQLDFPGSGFTSTRRSGNQNWRVYATGLDMVGCGAPTLDVINDQILLANASAGPVGTSSRGWVGPVPTPDGRLQIGEPNNAVVPTGSCLSSFPEVCGMSPKARWMWYQRPGSSCAFDDGDQREFLIFRLPMRTFYRYRPI